MEWAPGGREGELAPLTFYGNTRWEDLSDATRELFVEVTGKAGTALCADLLRKSCHRVLTLGRGCRLFNDDIVHQSWHTNDSYRRVIHLSWSNGGKREAGAPSPCPAAFEAAEDGSWLQYLLRPEPAEVEASAKL